MASDSMRHAAPVVAGWLVVSTGQVTTGDSKKTPHISSWESKVPPPKLPPPINKALLRDY